MSGGGAARNVKQVMACPDVNIVFTPSGQRGTFPAGTTVLTAAQKLGVDLDTVCGGRGICGRCQIRQSTGEFAKFNIVSDADHLGGATEREQDYDRRRGLRDGCRLGCQVEVTGDAVIDVPPESQRHRQVIRKRADARLIDLDPLITLHYVVVTEPDMHLQASDDSRLRQALETQWSLPDLAIDPAVLPSLQSALRQGQWRVTAAVYDNARIVAVWPGLKETVYGLAIDIGSTTIAAHLCDLISGAVIDSAGLMNPQIRFGEDLMSRVSYVMMNPGGDRDMTVAVRAAVNEMAATLTAEHGLTVEDLLLATVVGNPVMHHLFLGLDPTELGGAPFALATDAALDLPARDLELTLAPAARVYLLPCIAGHVGADSAAVVLSEGPQLGDEITLLVDVGTNAEIVLGNKDRLLAASSPTGPAFEGAQILCGQRAAAGAIERVRIDRETLEPRFSVIGAEIWSDAPDFAEATRRIGVTGICGSGIVEVLAEMFLSGILTADGTIDGALAARSDRIVADGRTHAYILHHGEPEIRITQSDVRAIQLAKAALYAGARLLMDRFGTDHVDRVVLAGAFGSHIDPLYATVLGMIPDCAPGKVGSAGNAAGTGARIALLNKRARREIEALVGEIEKIETAIEADFQAHFVDAMAIPHAKADYPHLGQQIELPARAVSTADATPKRRRRRRS